MSSSRQLVVPLVLTGACALLSMTSTGAVTSSSDDAAAVERLQLKTNAIELSVTPAFGGRVLSFNLRGQANVLKLGAAVEQQPAPEVSATAGDIAYFGHDVWVGPQSQWWLHQQLIASVRRRLRCGRRIRICRWRRRASACVGMTCWNLKACPAR
ncbi:exported hypothetical protein [Xanthomonas citri pv. bilvae]|nr:exported hypothetical protein [Xanthomonas citri pv. bilvae]